MKRFWPSAADSKSVLCGRKEEWVITRWREFQTGWLLRVITGFRLVPWAWHPRAHRCRSGGLANKLPPSAYHRARLLLLDVPNHLPQQFGVGTTEEVTFVQLSATAYQYRDAVRFNNEREVRLQELSEGLRVRILDLSSIDDSSFEPVREERKGVFVA